MKRFVLLFLAVAALLAWALLGGAPVSLSATPATKHYVCVACGLPCDAKVFDQPGNCPGCGMRLVEQAVAAAQQAARPPAKKVGILIFDGVEIIDYTGPWEVFGATGYEVYTVARSKQPVTTAMGMTVVPKHTFADAPQPDILLIPGGGVRSTSNDEATLSWIRSVNAHTTHTMSVCNGAFILASTGLLDGLSATTTAGNIERMRAAYPKVKVVDDQRFVDNGHLITTAGLTAGIDGALHVVSLMEGMGAAQSVALSEEYDWHPDGGFARAALADRLIPDVDLDSTGTWNIVSTQGGTDHWAIVVKGTTPMTAAELMDHIGKAFEKGKWVRVKPVAAHPSSALISDWRFSGRDGRPWTGTLKLDPVPGTRSQYTAEVKIARVG
jgi:putative intracellular protease/amidase/DNA-directed RNA polymerase subunit RPC12/RpoP